MVCIVYSRVSTEDQAKHGYSLPEQHDQGEVRAQALGYTQDQIIHIADDGVTGEIMDRPAMLRARELIRAGGVGHLVVMDIERFSRKLVNQLLMTDEIEHYGCKLEFLTFDWQDTPEGRLWLALRGAIAEFDRAKIRRQTMDCRLAKARKGGIPQFAHCFGFKFDKETDLLSIVPTQAAMVRQVYAWFLAGRTCDWISDELNRMGVPTAKGSTWMQASVKRVLRNSIYRGDYLTHQVNSEGTKHNKYRPVDQRIHVRPRPTEEHIHITVPRIIEDAVWYAAQEESARRRLIRPGHPVEFYLLGGLCRCGICGRAMIGMWASWSKPGERVRYYACGTKGKRHQGKPYCALPYQRADKLETQIWGVITGWMRDPEAFAEAVRGGVETGDPDQFILVKRQLSELQEERTRLVDLYIRDLIPKADSDRRLAEMKKREEFLRVRLTELRPAPPAQFDQDGLTEAFAEYSAGLDDAPPAIRKRVCQMLIEEIRVTPTEIRVKARNPRQFVSSVRCGQ